MRTDIIRDDYNINEENKYTERIHMSYDITMTMDIIGMRFKLSL